MCNDPMCGWTHSHCGDCNIDMDGKDEHHYVAADKHVCGSCYKSKYAEAARWKREPEGMGEVGI